MHTAHINHAFLDGVLDGSYPDVYYHFGVRSDEPIMGRMRELRAVILAGSGERIEKFAQRWSRERGDAEILAFTKEDRFVARYCDGVLFASHGMGMPSASIAVQELMRMAYFLKGGDLEALDAVFWARVGTSGGVGLPAGTIVVTTEAVMADLEPYRLLKGGEGEYRFDGHFPPDVVRGILAANEGSGRPIVAGRTVAGNEFFLEQFRLDGAICMETPESKMRWLRWLDEHGVRNIEMEGAMLAAYLNHWGFRHFAMVCCTLLNRLEGDQVTASEEELHRYAENAGDALFAYLRTVA